MPECPICFNQSNRQVTCFSRCSFRCCVNCFANTLKYTHRVEHTCPQCRGLSVKGTDRRFTNFINNHNQCLRRVNQLYEDHEREQTIRMVTIMWNAYRAE